MKKYYLSPRTSGIYLTQREAQCMSYFLRGWSNQEVAKALKISSSTVNSYLVSMKNKLECHSKMSLIAKICRMDCVGQLEKLVE